MTRSSNEYLLPMDLDWRADVLRLTEPRCVAVVRTSGFNLQNCNLILCRFLFGWPYGRSKHQS